MKKKHILLLALLILIGGFGYWYAAQSPYRTTTEVVTRAETSLDQDTVEFLMERIAGYQEVLLDENTELSNADRIGYLTAAASDYESLGNYEFAKSSLEEALDLGPESQPLYTNYSQLMYTMRDYDAAISYADQSIALGESDYLAWIWRGELEENLRRRGTAHEIYEAGLTVTDYDEDLLLEYAEYLEQIEDINRAIEIWREIGGRYPGREDFSLERIDKLKNE